MALQDPYAPDPMDPVVADAYAESRDPYGFEWPPPQWAMPDDEQVSTTEYGVTPGTTPPPPPPPPPDKKIGPGGAVIEETAQPVPAAADSQGDPNLIEMEPNAPVAQMSQPHAPSIGNMLDVQVGQRQPGPGGPLPLGSEAVTGSNNTDTPSPAGPDWASWTPGNFDPAGALKLPSQWSPPGAPEDRRDAKPHQSEQEMVQAEYERLRKLDPVAAATFIADHRIAQENRAAALFADVEKKNRETADRNLQQYLEAKQHAADMTKQLHADAMAVANTKIIRDRRSTGRRLGDIFLGALGGLIQGRAGGSNMGLQLVMKALDDDVEDQKAELANRREMIGIKRNFIADELARGKDLYQAQETYRLAALEGMKQDAITEANKFDPAGTQAIQRYQLVGQIEAEQRKAVDAFHKNQLDTRLKEQELIGKQLDNAKKLGTLGGGAPSIDKAIHTSDEMAALLPPGSWIPPKGWKGTIAEYSKLAEAATKGQGVSAGGKVGEEERLAQRERGGMPITDYDESGKPVAWIPHGSQPAVDAFRGKYAATKEAVRLLDEAMYLRSGWTSDAGNSEENQRLHSIMGKAMLTIKNAEKLGQITATDQDLIAGALGTTDFTKRKAIGDAVDQARKNLMQSLRVEADALGLSPRGQQKLDFPNMYGNQHVETDAEKRIKKNKYVDHVTDQSNPDGKPTKRDPNTGEILYQ